MTEKQPCGEPTLSGTPCTRQTPNGEPCYQHRTKNPARGGRPTKLRDNPEKRTLILVGARAGLKIEDQAGLAKVHPNTLRRALCCVITPRTPEITTDTPCDFCQDYVHAHGRGALKVLEECRPEFRAAATFGYSEKKRVEHSGSVETRLGGLVEALREGMQTATESEGDGDDA